MRGALVKIKKNAKKVKIRKKMAILPLQRRKKGF
jgi:hypothetical protein